MSDTLLSMEDTSLSASTELTVSLQSQRLNDGLTENQVDSAEKIVDYIMSHYYCRG